ncbi:MarR family transcriptional regulator [Saccharopolyspora erythraea]|uniref:MarR family winged helix-turn-helix transcriptional regulator n=1 Tax=Saccharopolyspora erythraea TaxID=1836 RepID=UPI001BAA2EE3|nr:MarR family transcriptional regulator [Saccharopolyspora erythraea]QUH05510.1 MarR family transcriptional regulator [Saccharopolyspora erythraea]
MGPTPELCSELLRPLRFLIGLKHVALQKGFQFNDEVPYAATGLLAELVHRGECRASDLAQHRVVDASVVSRQVHQLEQAGMITRRPDPDDRRVSLLRATADGERALAALERRKAEWLSRALSEWDDDAVRQLADLLSTAANDLHRAAHAQEEVSADARRVAEPSAAAKPAPTAAEPAPERPAVQRHAPERTTPARDAPERPSVQQPTAEQPTAEQPTPERAAPQQPAPAQPVPEHHAQTATPAPAARTTTEGA